MEKILIINTGGTFNKVYNPLTGNLDIDLKGDALQSVAKNWLTKLTIINIVGKDSLDMKSEDREKIYRTIKEDDASKVIIVHGTDTMDQTAYYLDSKNLKKSIILTGAMVPYSINPLEATANFASAYGYISALNREGVYIAMNGVIKDYQRVIKNKEKGYFKENFKTITL